MPSSALLFDRIFTYHTILYLILTTPPSSSSRCRVGCSPGSCGWYRADPGGDGSCWDFLRAFCAELLHLLVALVFHHSALLEICNLSQILAIKLSQRQPHPSPISAPACPPTLRKRKSPRTRNSPSYSRNSSQNSYSLHRTPFPRHPYSSSCR
jgi:hypothetical protein